MDHRTSERNYTAPQAVADGSVAYDLSRFDRRRSVRTAASEPVRRERQRPEPRQKFAFSVILMYAAIAGLAALLIGNYMTLTVMTDEYASLEKQLGALKNEEIILRKQYDQRYILSEVEVYAIENLGMVKLETSMMEYIELPDPDVIIKTDPYESEKVGGFFREIFNRIREFVEFIT